MKINTIQGPVRRLCRLHSWKLFIFLFAMVISAGQAIASPQYEKVSINIENRPIKDLLKEIESKSQLKFFYKTGEIDLDRKVSLKANEMPVDEILAQVFNDGYITFSRVKNQIVLKRTKVTASSAISIDTDIKESEEEALAVVISGTVKDPQGAGIPGVNVLEKGTSNGTLSNMDGGYTLSVAGSSSVIVFSYVGYVTQEAQVGSNTSLNVVLAEDVQNLSEVLVMGYASQNKEDLTGAVSTIKAEQIANLPATSVAETLQGRVSGVQVVKSSGQPGANSDIVIRGGGSVNGMAPLYIVDGVRMTGDVTFNNGDIESMEILKDASAAAIYGAQAAGGVILIQTKRGTGTKDKMNINFNTYAGARNSRPLIPLLNTQDFLTARKAFGGGSEYNYSPTLPDNDYNEILYKTGSDQNYALSLNGSSDKANYYVSANYFKQDGVQLDNSYKRYSFRVNSDYKLNKKVKVGETLYLFKTVNDPSTVGFMWRTVPTFGITEPNGSWSNAPGYFNGRNPLQAATTSHGITDAFAMQGNTYVDVQILPGLSIRGTVGANIGSSVNHQFNEAFNTSGSQVGLATLTNGWRNYERYTANAVLTYNKTFGKHDIKALAGYEMYREDSRSVNTSASNFAIPLTESYALNTDVASQRVTSGGPSPDQRLLSQFARLNYAYDGKYLVSATVRRDGSDRFGPENKWGVFPAFSAGWKISKEAFFDNVQQISSLQLRASYGSLGNSGALGQYLYQPSYVPSNQTADANGTRLQAYGRNLTLPNAGIKWEEVNTTDVGVDVAFLDNKLTLTADYYNRNTKDMIYQLPVAMSAGYNGSPTYVNIGELNNKGLEFALNYQVTQNDLSVNVGLNGSFNKNMVVSLANVPGAQIISGTGGAYLANQLSKTVAGQPMSMFYGYVVEGIYATDQQYAERGVSQGAVGTGIGAGDLIYKDLDGDHQITAADRDYTGNPWPKFNYGLNVNAKYKAFDLSFSFQGVMGVDIYNANRHYSQFLAGDYTTSPRVFDASFFNGNGLTDTPRLGYFSTPTLYIKDPNGNYTKPSSYYVENGAFLKLRNLQFGYNVPASLLSKVRLQKMRVYFMADNILTFTKYSGVDPEVVGEGNAGGSNSVARGIDTNSAYPQTTFWGFGLNLDF